MTYGCSDFVESILDALKIELPDGAEWEEVSAQADLALEAIARLRREAAPATPSLAALVSDLWWFIENVTDDDPTRSDRFFALRERVRGQPPAKLPALAVVLEGGMVAAVISDDPVAVAAAIQGVTIIDYDVEGAEPADLSWVRQDSGEFAEAVVHEPTIIKATIGLDDIRPYDVDDDNGGDPSVTAEAAR